ncbi:hypothetical protein V6N12_029503 [Hibiscus sabdariffa]|uniref:Uncharacterized protein n=1 Tax=Hibiscus sabdariffa TaxID=183260 RepID=A0ABR2CWP0_9ROSI
MTKTIDMSYTKEDIGKHRDDSMPYQRKEIGKQIQKPESTNPKSFSSRLPLSLLQNKFQLKDSFFVLSNLCEKILIQVHWHGTRSRGIVDSVGELGWLRV